MARYLTRQYAAVSWAEATRLAQLDLTELRKIRHTRDVDLIHRTDWWAWWSDQRLTPAIGLPEGLRPQGLSGDAEDLMTDVWASGSVPECGWKMLAEIKCVISVERLANQFGEHSGSSFLEKVLVELSNGLQCLLYRQWHWSEDDYLCEIKIHLLRTI